MHRRRLCLEISFSISMKSVADLGPSSPATPFGSKLAFCKLKVALPVSVFWTLVKPLLILEGSVYIEYYSFLLSAFP